MKKSILFLLLISFVPLASFGNDDIVADYNRSSLYVLSMLHDGTSMYQNIFKTMIRMTPPDRYNDHNLSLRVINSYGKAKDEEAQQQITKFLETNKVAQRLVSKWFDRNKADGSFDMDLIKERGNYNASVEDVAMALRTTRGKAMLEDAGEQLIGNTFIIVNDISYVNKQAKADIFGAFFEGISLIAGVIPGSKGGDVAKLVKNTGSLGNSISSLVAGFTVKIESYLYRLVWNDEIANTFYTQYYYDSNNPDPTKKRAYNMAGKQFELEYIGKYEATSSKTVLKGLKNDDDVFMKVLTRALDENIVQLQKQHDVFKVTAPVFKVDNDVLCVHIGMKEGVSPSSRYEVLERVEDEEGRISYKRKGVIRAVKDKIWDNRCMAIEEEAEGANLGFTVFEKVSGDDIYPGMLIREIK